MIKRLLFLIMSFIFVATAASQERFANIEFSESVHNFGTFLETEPQHCTFLFTNTGNIPLIISQTMTSCGCTVSKYTREPIQPGKQGKIDVTYNGKGKFPGHFRKTITVRSNAKTPLVRIYIEGEMKDVSRK